MPDAIDNSWQDAIRNVDVDAIARLLAEDPQLIEQHIVHTRGNGTTFGLMPLEMVNKSLAVTKLLVQAGSNPNKNNPEGNALPLHNASLDVMEYLLESGADVNKIGYEECSPLMYEVYYKRHDSASLLISHGADLDYQRNLDGFTCLHFASSKRDEKMVKILLAAGANPNFKDSSGRTPLDIDVENDASNIANLIKQNAG